MRIREIAQSRPRFGYQRIHIMLRREGWQVNKKRVHRLYRLEGLQVRMRVRRRKRMSLHRGPVPPASGRNQHWSMDFVHDQLLDGRAFRVLTVIDQWSRESVLLEADFRADRAERRRRARARRRAAARCRRRSPSITAPSSPPRRSTSGPTERGVELDFIRPESPWRTALIESFNGRLRDECLNANEFVSLDDAKARIEAWRLDYNEHRPHSAPLTVVRTEPPKRPIPSFELSETGTKLNLPEKSSSCCLPIGEAYGGTDQSRATDDRQERDRRD